LSDSNIFLRGEDNVCVHNIQLHGGNSGISLRIVHTITRWNVSGQLHIPVTMPGEKNYQQLLNRGLGGPQTQHGHFEEDTNLLPPC
jgi:hypothetical protein